MRRGGRVVDRVALEMRSTRKRTGGSNPSLSASHSYSSRNFLYQLWTVLNCHEFGLSSCYEC